MTDALSDYVAELLLGSQVVEELLFEVMADQFRENIVLVGLNGVTFTSLVGCDSTRVLVLAIDKVLHETDSLLARQLHGTNCFLLGGIERTETQMAGSLLSHVDGDTLVDVSNDEELAESILQPSLLLLHEHFISIAFEPGAALTEFRVRLDQRSL